MPGHPALPVVTNSYAFLLCMRGCGCVGTRHSPRPFSGKAEIVFTPRTHRAARTRMCVLPVVYALDPVIASAAKQSSFLLSLTMDCFASLAMTVETVCLYATHHPSSPRTRGPITTGSSFAPKTFNSISNTSGTAYGSLRSQGRH